MIGGRIWHEKPRLRSLLNELTTTMEHTVLFPSETPLVLRIKDTLSAIVGQMPLVSLGRSAQVSKLWKEVVCILSGIVTQDHNI